MCSGGAELTTPLASGAVAAAVVQRTGDCFALVGVMASRAAAKRLEMMDCVGTPESSPAVLSASWGMLSGEASQCSSACVREMHSWWEYETQVQAAWHAARLTGPLWCSISATRLCCTALSDGRRSGCYAPEQGIISQLSDPCHGPDFDLTSNGES